MNPCLSIQVNYLCLEYFRSPKVECLIGQNWLNSYMYYKGDNIDKMAIRKKVNIWPFGLQNWIQLSIIAKMVEWLNCKVFKLSLPKSTDLISGKECTTNWFINLCHTTNITILSSEHKDNLQQRFGIRFDSKQPITWHTCSLTVAYFEVIILLYMVKCTTNIAQIPGYASF